MPARLMTVLSPVTGQIIVILTVSDADRSAVMLLLGLTPIGFLAFGWVTNPLPPSICGALGCSLVLTQLARGPDLRHELAKRLHL